MDFEHEPGGIRWVNRLCTGKGDSLQVYVYGHFNSANLLLEIVVSEKQSYLNDFV